MFPEDQALDQQSLPKVKMPIDDAYAKPPIGSPGRKGFRVTLDQGALVRPLDSLPTSQVGGAPVTLHGNHRDAKRLGDFLFAETAKEAQFDDARGAWIGFVQPGQHVVKCQEIFAARDWIPAVNGRQADALLHTASFLGHTRPCVVDEDPPHRLCGDGKEMGAVVVGDGLRTQQAQAQLVDQRVRFECVIGALMV